MDFNVNSIFPSNKHIKVLQSRGVLILVAWYCWETIVTIYGHCLDEAMHP